MAFPILPLVALGAVALFALGGKKGAGGAAAPPAGGLTPSGQPVDEGYLKNAALATPPPDLPPAIPAPAPKGAPSNIVTGQSGTRWKVALASRDGERLFMDVFALQPTETRVLRYVQQGDNRDYRIFVEAPPGVDPAIVRAAMVDFGVVAADTRLSVPPMPLVLKQKVAAAMKAIGIDESGSLTGTPTVSGVQTATIIAGEIEKAGYPEAAALLREYIKRAKDQIPPPPVEKQVPLPPSIPADLQAKIQQAIQLERDPDKLRALQNALIAYASDPTAKALIEQLGAMILAIESQVKTGDALEKIEQVMTSPKPPPLPPDEPPEPPPPPPAPKSPAELAALEMSAHLWEVQQRFGMPGAKGNQDLALVKRTQTALGTTADGKPGPGTMLLVAKNGVTKLPLVMYWPKSATKERVLKYRSDLEALAKIADGAGATGAAAELRASAARERGQGGIVGPMPA